MFHSQRTIIYFRIFLEKVHTIPIILVDFVHRAKFTQNRALRR